MSRESQLDGVTGALIPTRLSLLSRLKNWDDRESWNDFFNTYWKVIFCAARKAGLTEAESEDVVQETIICVCRKMPEFTYDPKVGSFKNWLWQLTRWRIHDQFRKRLPLQATGRPAARDEDGTDLIAQVPDQAGPVLEAAWDEEWESNLFEAALERVKRKVNPKAYQIFDLHVLQKWPVQKIRTLLRVNSAKIYLSAHRTSSLLKKEMRLLEKETSWQEMAARRP